MAVRQAHRENSSNCQHPVQFFLSFILNVKKKECYYITGYSVIAVYMQGANLFKYLTEQLQMFRS